MPGINHHIEDSYGGILPAHTSSYTIHQASANCAKLDTPFTDTKNG